MFSHSVVSDSLGTPWTVAHQGPLSMGFPRQEYWSGLPFPPSGALPYPGIEPASPILAGRFFTTEPPVCARMLSYFSCIPLFATPWTVAQQAPLSMGFPRQEYWSGLPFLSLGDLPDPGIKPVSAVSPALQPDSLSTEPSGKVISRWDDLRGLSLSFPCDKHICF